LLLLYEPFQSIDGIVAILTRAINDVAIIMIVEILVNNLLGDYHENALWLLPNKLVCQQLIGCPRKSSLVSEFKIMLAHCQLNYQ
jgi:hypothetical protein